MINNTSTPQAASLTNKASSNKTMKSDSKVSLPTWLLGRNPV